jgi:hypothetical protein
LNSLKTGIDKCCWDTLTIDSDGVGKVDTSNASCTGIPATNDYCCEYTEDGLTPWCYGKGLELWYDGVDNFGEWAENDHTNVVVFNMRTRSITHRIPLETCGDGIKDDETQWFEQCERNYKFNDDCATNALELDGVTQV